MKKKFYLLPLCILCTVLALAGCSKNTSNVPSASDTPKASNAQNTNPSTAGNEKDTDGDGVPDAAEKVLGTNPYASDTNGNGVSDKDDQNPLFTENPIKETSTIALPIEIKDIRVEDNVGADKKDAPDHLEITMKNTSTKVLDKFEVYITITDKKETNKVEGYYVKLEGLTVGAGENKTIHFDNKVSESGHYLGNPNGLYGTSSNGLTFKLQLHADGYKPMDFTVDKSEGTAEVAD
jgi:hypothetical protein